MLAARAVGQRGGEQRAAQGGTAARATASAIARSVVSGGGVAVLLDRAERDDEQRRLGELGPSRVGQRSHPGSLEPAPRAGRTHDDGGGDEGRRAAEGRTVGQFTTIAPDGTLISRPMAMQEVEFDGDLWFFASRSSARCPTSPRTLRSTSPHREARAGLADRARRRHRRPGEEAPALEHRRRGLVPGRPGGPRRRPAAGGRRLGRVLDFPWRAAGQRDQLRQGEADGRALRRRREREVQPRSRAPARPAGTLAGPGGSGGSGPYRRHAEQHGLALHRAGVRVVEVAARGGQIRASRAASVSP